MAARLFTDEFDRADGPLGPQWVDGHDVYPEWFEPLGIVSEKVHCTDPKTRPGAPYADYPAGQQVNPPHDSKLYHGIGCAWRETGSKSARVLVRWSGDIGVSEESQVEAGPLLHISPDSDRFAFGIWPSELLGTPILIAGYIGAPPERFGEFQISVHALTHTDGNERNIEAVSDGTNVQVYVDGTLLTAWSTYGTNLPLHASVKNSTLHGFCVDAHLTEPSQIPSLPALTRTEIEANDEQGWIGNEGDTVVGTLIVDPGASGRIELTADAANAPAIELFASDANTDPILSFGSFIGTPLLGFGPGSSTPDAYIGRSAAGQITSGISGVNMFHGGYMQNITTVTATSYTTLLGDRANIITRSNASASTHDWPSNATAAIPVGTVIQVINIGAGTVTHQAGSGATLVTGSTTSQTQGQRRTAIKTGTDQWSIT